MARIRWAQLCELAFLDSNNRLCMIGVTHRLAVPSLPLAVYQLMLVVHVVDVRIGDELEVDVWITTPGGLPTSPDHPNGVQVTVAAEYLFITLRDVPLTEEGVYGVSVSIEDREPVTLDVTVLCVSASQHATVQ